jgi:hypothetical protein
MQSGNLIEEGVALGDVANCTCDFQALPVSRLRNDIGVRPAAW